MNNSQLKSVLVGLCLAGLSLGRTTPAAAQEEGGVVLEPTTTTEGGGDAGGGREPLISGSTVDVNEGFWLAAGLNYMSWGGYGGYYAGGFGSVGVGFRFEAGIPIIDLPLGRLAIYLPFVINPDRWAGYKWQTFVIDPGLRYEVSLLERYGRLSLFGDLGAGVWIDRYKDTNPGGFTESRVYGSMRFAVGATFTFPFGLFLILQPVGVVARMGHNPEGGASYEYALLAGYRF